MSLEKKDYRKRLIDDKIDRYLKIFGAISIQGPKWCGKTWTSLKHANSVSYMTEKSPRDLAKVDPNYSDILRNTYDYIIPAYHMNKEHWNTIIVDEKVDNNLVKELIEQSYQLTK